MEKNKNKKNVVLTGFMGSGKTHIGKILAKNLRFDFFDTDEIIKKECNMSITEIFETFGEAYFRSLEFEVCKNLSKQENAIISLGGGSLENKKILELFLGYSVIIFVDTPFERCYSRSRGTDRPLVKQLSKKELFELYLKRRSNQIAISDYILKAK